MIRALLVAVEASPGDTDLRRHVAQLLMDATRCDEAWTHAVAGLSIRPDDLGLLRIAIDAGAVCGHDISGHQRIHDALAGSAAGAGATLPPPSPDIPDRVPMAAGDVPSTVDELLEQWQGSDAPPEPDIGAFSRPGNTFADVGGLTDVKRRIERSFLAPMRNPDLQRAFGKAAGGGLVLWGPPGCGKTFIARALAGELGANFYEIGLSEVLDMWVGSSERNLAAIFEFARRQAPCVLFFDELDAIGQKRSNLRGASGMRTVINQLLTELDGATSDNDGVFFLAATNHPWDLDPALVRPGRFDRKLLVLPPDRDARQAIFEIHLRDRPHDGDVDTAKLAKKTEGLTGADIKLICDDATESALSASVDSDRIVPISDAMINQSMRAVRSSIGAWLQTAKNYATFSNGDGDLDDLLAYVKKHA